MGHHHSLMNFEHKYTCYIVSFWIHKLNEHNKMPFVLITLPYYLHVYKLKFSATLFILAMWHMHM